MTGLYEGRISVEDPVDPEPLPPELADALERDEAAGASEPTPAAGDEDLTRRKAGFLDGLLRELFGLAGWVSGLGLPGFAAEALERLWTADPERLGAAAGHLAPLVPERWVASRAAGRLGLLVGVATLGGLLRRNVTETIRYRKEVLHALTAHPADVESAADAGAGRAGPRPGGAGRAAPVEPRPDRTPPPVDGFTGAGLGLGEGE